MPAPYDYRTVVPDIGPALSTIADAIDQRREKKRLSEIGGMLSSGNLSGAADAAYKSGDLKTGLAAQGMDQARQDKIMGILGNAAQQADTPEKWTQFIGTVSKRFPGADLTQYQDFTSRDAVLAEFPAPAPEFGVASPGATIFNKGTGEVSGTVPGKPGGGIANLSVTEKKAVFEAEDDIANLGGTIETLTKARDLNQGTYEGVGAKTRGFLGAKLPDLMVPDFIASPEGGSATTEWQNIMSMEAIKNMSQTLKGVTTDFELRKFENVLADPSTPKDIRERIIDRMLTLAARKKQILENRMEGVRGRTYFGPQGGMTESPGIPDNIETLEGDIDPQTAIDQANEAIAQGADPEAVKARLLEMGIQLAD